MFFLPTSAKIEVKTLWKKKSESSKPLQQIDLKIKKGSVSEG